MQVLIDSFLVVYVALFPIINPVGSAPIFLELTQFCTDQQRNELGRRVAINSVFLLVGSVFIGSHLLGFFGVSLPVVRIGGGLIVTAFGWKLLNSEAPVDNADAARDAASVLPDAFYPLTMPLTVGPGSISVAVTLGSQRPNSALRRLLLQDGGSILGIVALAVTIYLCYRFAGRLVRFIGPNGENVLIRLSAFILVCIGIQIIWNGWRGLNGLAA